ncbi:Sterol 3-beta-glucosyltransferase UGT80A2 [Sesamum angolense]|uniref:sterol 3beta-glucosyltransferase n=1 Tax=Sesamum angolense TaxID=2727404 RepID=A0AAE2C345_9LAMI|nr:Sterol 3-beta-glucosyltransferase UGT80A2 [Sesamum angolense]
MEGAVDLDQRRSPPEAVVVPMGQAGEASSSSSSGEVSVKFEKDSPGVTVASIDSNAATAAALSNGGSDSLGSVGATVSRVNTMPPKILSSEKLEPPLVLDRSKTERQRHNNLLPEEAARFLMTNFCTAEDSVSCLLAILMLYLCNSNIHVLIRSNIGTAGVQEELQYVPPLQIVMLIVGTRGDVQPFVAIGKRLQDYGHRVRLATHSNFKEFVLTSGLEFYPLGGDPKVLAGYMVKNKGFLPSGPSEIPVQRNQMKEIIYSLLPACKEPDIDSGIPFKADAIIANPPAYGHTHVAEALKIPIHIFFTMPWTPTSEFPHPLSRVKQSAGYRLSYQIVDSLIWLGIRDMINDVRKKKLKLRPVTYLSGSQGSETDIPYGYIWSPHLVPKHKVDVVGFCFLDLATNYEPPESLLNWLKAGPKPIYIGFACSGTRKNDTIIVEALEITKQRGIINKGWGGLGELAEEKDFVYLLDNCPHDWLFLQCAAVVHHGGAGTTAAGLKAAVKESAVELAKAMENEDGVTGAVKAFLKHLPRKNREPDPIPEPTPSSLFSVRSCFGCS